ncbi:MAG: translation initiation factor, partial [Muribaculaceae bacterium]|nr:translation initiation factor [Muribaculaceae bacterium]
KGRAGKTATIIAGFDSEEQAADTASQLKKSLATGGSARGCEVLLQGDRRTDAADALRRLGFRV